MAYVINEYLVDIKVEKKEISETYTFIYMDETFIGKMCKSLSKDFYKTLLDYLKRGGFTFTNRNSLELEFDDHKDERLVRIVKSNDLEYEYEMHFYLNGKTLYPSIGLNTGELKDMFKPK